MQLIKKIFFFFISFSLLSCSVVERIQKGRKNPNGNSLSYFLFKDVSGQYVVKREVSQNNKQLAVRQSLFAVGDESHPLEKTVTVTRVGFVRSNGKEYIASRPMASQYSIWFEKKEFFSQMKLDIKKKGMDVYLKSPEEKWKGNQFIRLPKGRKFCWFSQLPDCLKRIVNLEQRSKKSSSFYIIWDGYPYYSEQLENLSGKAYSQASISYDGEFDNTYRFAVSVENQIIFYHFNYELEFERMFWVNQGITMVKKAM